MELGNHFFLFKCDDDDVLDRALIGGPWVIAENYVAVQQWKLGFYADAATINSTSVWVLSGFGIQ